MLPLRLNAELVVALNVSISSPPDFSSKIFPVPRATGSVNDKRRSAETSSGPVAAPTTPPFRSMAINSRRSSDSIFRKRCPNRRRAADDQREGRLEPKEK